MAQNFAIGDIVIICNDVEILKRSQEKQCYTEEMNKTLGEIGLVRKVNSNSLLVSFGMKSWQFHPSALSKVVFPSKDSKYEIAKVRSVLNKRNKDGVTALHIAVYEEYVDVVKRLLDLGCDVNTHDEVNDSVLMDAIGRGNVDIVSLLLEKDADYTHTNCVGWNVLHVAALSPSVDMFRTLSDKLDGKTIMKLNSQKAKNGHTPLHLAIRRGSTDVAELLIKIPGTDVNSQDINFFTPLHLAVIQENIKIVQQLLHHGADKHIQDSSSNIPIDYAEKNGNRKISSLLM
ncbi:E3 ubiquitin-protein ligase mind-bomb-like isoform X2 [Anopheles darlingi]|nr:E3 ubiquitin-protein ligase mind-bomb-like isoform X2 [Anopheles darlingi]